MEEILKSWYDQGYAEDFGDGAWTWNDKAKKTLPAIVRTVLTDILYGRPCHDFMRKELMKYGFNPDTGFPLEDEDE